MASATEPGMVYIMVDRAGSLKQLLADRNAGAISAGGSPDGVLANLTIDKHKHIPKDTATPIKPGDVIRLFLKMDAADGIDVSDSYVSIPFWEDGSLKFLTGADFGMNAATYDLPASTPAAQLHEIGRGYTVPTNVKTAYIGGGAIVLSIEDDTA